MIKGLSESRRLPRLGKIRLGIKKKKSKPDDQCRHPKEEMCFYCSYPVETEYFVCPDEVKRIHGDKPTELDVYLPIDQIEKVFPQRLAWYSANGRLRCAGDGESALRIFKDVPPAMKKGYATDGNLPEDTELVDFDCPCPLLDSGDCSRNATLNVILPRVSLGGVYQITTGSVYSIISINSGIDYARALFEGRVGGASMLPLKLSRVKEKIIYQEKSSWHYILQIRFDGTPEQRNSILESKRMVMPLHLQLPAPDKPQPGDQSYDTPPAGSKIDPKDNVPEFKTPTQTTGPRTALGEAGATTENVGEENLGDLTGTQFGEKLDAFKQRQAAKAEGGGSTTPHEPSPGSGLAHTSHANDVPDPIPESVAKILAELDAAPPDKKAEVFAKHSKLINSWATRFKLMAAAARGEGGKLSSSVEKREKLFREINLFTSVAQCEQLEKDAQKVTHGMEVEDIMKVGEANRRRKKEIEAEATERGKEGRLL